MAIIKRLPCHGQSGSSALDYVIYKHDESTRAPILDANGNRELREDFYLSGINCSAFAFSLEMVQLETVWGKNLEPGDIRMQQFIISYDPKDAKDYILDGPRAQMLSMTLIRRCLPGTLGIACTHLDGDHHAGNIHTHVFLSSIQYTDVISPVMKYPAAVKSGDKLCFPKSTTREMKEQLASIVEEANLHPNNLFQIAGDRISNGEYWAQYRGQMRLDEENRKRMEAGLDVEETVFRGTKQKLREALQDAMFQSASVEQFRKMLETHYQVKITENGAWWRFGFMGDAQDYASSTLGANYYKEEISRVIEGNRLHPECMEEYRTQKARKQELEKTLPKPDITTVAGCRMVFQRPEGDLLLVSEVCKLALAMEKESSRETLQEKWPGLARTVSFLQKHRIRSMAQLDPLEVTLRGNLLYYRQHTEERNTVLRDRINTLYYAGVLEQHGDRQARNRERPAEGNKPEDFYALREVADGKRYFKENGIPVPVSVKRAWEEKMEAQKMADRTRERKEETELDLRSFHEVRAVLEPWKDRLPSQPVPDDHVIEVITPGHLRSREDLLRHYLDQGSAMNAHGRKEDSLPETGIAAIHPGEQVESASLPMAAGSETVAFDYIVQIEEDPALEITGRNEMEQAPSEGYSASVVETGTSPGSGIDGPGMEDLDNEMEQMQSEPLETEDTEKQNRPIPETAGKEDLDERIRKLMERRGSAFSAGTAAGRTGGEREEDTETLIGKAKAGIRRADSIEEDSRADRDDKVAQRADRDAERERRAVEARARAERERREEFERSRAQRKRRRSVDFER